MLLFSSEFFKYLRDYEDQPDRIGELFFSSVSALIALRVELGQDGVVRIRVRVNISEI